VEFSTLRSVLLEMVLSKDSGSSGEEEVDPTFTERESGQKINGRRAFMAHSGWHREEETIATYIVNRENGLVLVKF
jgi:hypothetical protein